MFRPPKNGVSRQASICQEGLRMPLNGNKRKAHPPFPCRHNALNALFIPPTRRNARQLGGESDEPEGRINSASPFADRTKPTKFTYLREPLFFPSALDPFNPDNCITSHCVPASRGPIVGFPWPFDGNATRLHFYR